MLRRFFKAVLPFMLAFAFSGLHIIVDGFFIGRNIGDLELAAVNIAHPMAVLVQTADTGIRMGGAVWIMLHREKQEEGQEMECLGNTMTLLLLGGFLVMALLFGVCGPVPRIPGAEGRVYQKVMTYIQILAGGSLLQFFATGFVPLIRNYDGTMTAMISMIVGFVTNIVLDYLFMAVYHYGAAGAAAATVIRQGVTVVPCLVFMWSRIRGLKKKDLILRGGQAAKIIGTGISLFGLTISLFIMIMLINGSAPVYGGEAAAAAYVMVSYVVVIAQLLLRRVGDGSQPLMSFYPGIGKPELAGKVRNMAYIFAASVALANATTLYLLREMIPRFFGAPGLVSSIVAGSLSVFSLGFIFVAFYRTTTFYFYATKRNLFSYVTVYGEPVVLCLLLFFGLPPTMEPYGAWLPVSLTQAVLTVADMVLLREEQSSCSNYVAEWLWTIDKKIRNKFRSHDSITRNTAFPFHLF